MDRSKAVQDRLNYCVEQQIERKDKSMKTTSLAVAMLFCFACSYLLNAQDKAVPDSQKITLPADKPGKEVKQDESKSKLAGKWEGKITRQDDQEMKLTFTFKVDGEKLSGAVESPRGELDIKEGKVKGDELSFNVEIGDSTIDYQGKLSDGKIKMKSKGPMGEREFTLSRPVEINGRWLSKFETPDGESMELTFTFKVDGDKLTGKVESPMGEIELTNGKVKGDEFSFDVDVGGNTIGHDCKISGDEIKMKIKGFGGDESQPAREFTLKRAPAK
ncbi:MAG: hypothetical protein ABSG67_21380 [Thermoguttaceae bacterium]|jgi:hypothetical protein